jgi:hypothetical protein
MLLLFVGSPSLLRCHPRIINCVKWFFFFPILQELWHPHVDVLESGYRSPRYLIEHKFRPNCSQAPSLPSELTGLFGS